MPNITKVLTDTVDLKWYEKVAEWVDKPGFKAFAILSLIGVGALVVYQFAVKPIMRKLPS